MNAAKSSWDWVQTNVRKIAQFCIFVLAAGLLLLEAGGAVTLTWKTISLVTILTIVAVLNDLEKIDFGDFGGVRFQDEIATVERRVDRLETPGGQSAGEARIAVESVRSDASTGPEKRSAVAERVVTADAVADDGDDGTGSGAAETDAVAERLYERLETEPRAALSQLRFELERAQQRAGRSVDEATAAASLEVRSLCRTAVRDVDDLDRDAAARVIDLGLRVLDRLLVATTPDDEPSGTDRAR